VTSFGRLKSFKRSNGINTRKRTSFVFRKSLKQNGETGLLGLFKEKEKKREMRQRQVDKIRLISCTKTKDGRVICSFEHLSFDHFLTTREIFLFSLSLHFYSNGEERPFFLAREKSRRKSLYQMIMTACTLSAKFDFLVLLFR